MREAFFFVPKLAGRRKLLFFGHVRCRRLQMTSRKGALRGRFAKANYEHIQHAVRAKLLEERILLLDLCLMIRSPKVSTAWQSFQHLPDLSTAVSWKPKVAYLLEHV